MANCKLGDIFRQIGRVEDAHDQYDRSVRLAEVFLGNQHEPLRRGLPGQSLAGARPVEDVVASPAEARSYLQRAVELSAYVVSMAPSLGHARRGQIEATFQLGRAQSFAYDYSEAEKSFQKTRELATRWLADEPRNSQASNMLASCSRKLADMRKFAKDFDGASKLYRDAIAIGERLMIDVPGNTRFQSIWPRRFRTLRGSYRRQENPTRPVPCWSTPTPSARV